MRLRKRYFSLLEVLISVVLTSLLLSTLLWFYRDVVFLGKKMDETTKDLFSIRYLEGRLSDILSNVVFNNTQDKDFAFYTENNVNGHPNLILTYDNGVSQDEVFSNHVLGKLYVDEKNRLCLATWPSFTKKKIEDPFKMIHEVLLEDVEDIRYSFYIAPIAGKVVAPREVKTDGEKETPYPPDTWQTVWKRNYRVIPAIVKIEIRQKGREQPFYFAFPMSDKNLKINYSLPV